VGGDWSLPSHRLTEAAELSTARWLRAGIRGMTTYHYRASKPGSTDEVAVGGLKAVE
jgi:hypothetical protein